MKKLISLFIAITMSALAYADGYSYLIFQTLDGTQTSFPVASLTMTVGDGTLTVNGQTFQLAELDKMFFSEDEATAINGVVAGDANDGDAAAQVFDLLGRKISKDDMKHGTYIVKKNGKTYKVAVR